MLKESNISANEIRSRSGPPSRLAATQDPDRKAVLKPATDASLALSPSHTAGMTTKPGSASKALRRSGGVMVHSLGCMMLVDSSMIVPRPHAGRYGARPSRPAADVCCLVRPFRTRMGWAFRSSQQCRGTDHVPSARLDLMAHSLSKRHCTRGVAVHQDRSRAHGQSRAVNGRDRTIVEELPHPSPH